MVPSSVKYQFVEDVERLDYYVLGGYHPVTLGDEFCGRYIVAHKLDSGALPQPGWQRIHTMVAWLPSESPRPSQHTELMN